MSQNAINYEEAKRNLVAVAGKSNKIEPLVGALVGILDRQPELASDRDGNPVLDVNIYGTLFQLSCRNGAILMHWISQSMMSVGNFTDEEPDSCIRDVFEWLRTSATT